VSSLSSCHISPVGVVWWLTGGGGMMSSDALPDVYAFSLRIPNTALCVEIPEDVNFPDSGGVADYGGHR